MKDIAIKVYYIDGTTDECEIPYDSEIAKKIIREIKSDQTNCICFGSTFVYKSAVKKIDIRPYKPEIHSTSDKKGR